MSTQLGVPLAYSVRSGMTRSSVWGDTRGKLPPSTRQLLGRRRRSSGTHVTVLPTRAEARAALPVDDLVHLVLHFRLQRVRLVGRQFAGVLRLVDTRIGRVDHRI